MRPLFERASVLIVAVVTALYALVLKLVELLPTLIVLYIVWRVLLRFGYV